MSTLIPVGHRGPLSCLRHTSALKLPDLIWWIDCCDPLHSVFLTEILWYNWTLQRSNTWLFGQRSFNMSPKTRLEVIKHCLTWVWERDLSASHRRDTETRDILNCHRYLFLLHQGFVLHTRNLLGNMCTKQQICKAGDPLSGLGCWGFSVYLTKKLDNYFQWINASPDWSNTLDDAVLISSGCW